MNKLFSRYPSAYTPDNFVIIKINEKIPLYKLFVSWNSQYVLGEEWRLNSGIVRIEVEGDYTAFTGYSNSVYIVNNKTEGITNSYCQSILDNFLKKAQEDPENPIAELVCYDEYIAEMLKNVTLYRIDE